mgnify:FL=1
MKAKFVVILSWLFLSTYLVAAPTENAFGSFISNNANNSTNSMSFDSTQVIDKTLHPLVQNPVITNTLMAIMISPSVKIAFIRTQNGDEYFIRVGDKLGNSEGEITDIKSNTIEITEDNEVISLALRNRSASNETSK